LQHFRNGEASWIFAFDQIGEGEILKLRLQTRMGRNRMAVGDPGATSVKFIAEPLDYPSRAFLSRNEPRKFCWERMPDQYPEAQR
jgi:hypothetical protein